MRGRVMALYALVFLGSTPLGGPLIGWISQQWGARSGLFVGGAVSLVAAAAAALSVWRQRRRTAEQEADDIVSLPSFEPALEEATV